MENEQRICLLLQTQFSNNIGGRKSNGVLEIIRLKQTKLQWLQNASQINVDNPNKVRIQEQGKGEYPKSLKQTVRTGIQKSERRHK
jgi:hypothetical protein